MQGDSTTIPSICEFCKKEYFPYPRQDKNRPPQRFCSILCNNKSRIIPDEERFWSKVNKEGKMPDPEKYPELKTCCWEWTGSLDKDGYGQWSYRENNHPHRTSAHRKSWELANGEISDGKFVLHHCDNEKCVRTGEDGHLYLSDHKKNMKDMVERKRQAIGENHGNAVVTDAQVIEIRQRYQAGETQRSLARAFNMGKTTVAHIVNYHYWKHLA